MKIVLTGATGFIGRALVRQLLERGDTVTALTRDPARAATVLPVRCTCVAWNPAVVDPAILRNADAVMHLAGEGVADRRWTAARKRVILDSRVASSQALVQAMELLDARERPKTFISASALGYYGDRGDEELDESSSAGSGFLAEVCRAWEAAVCTAERLGIRTATIRIGVVLGKGGGALDRMLAPFRLGLGGRLGSGRQWMSWIHRDDLVGLLILALTEPSVTGAINGVAPHPVTNAEFTRALGQALHRPTLLPVPALALRAALGEMAAVLLDSQRVVPRAAERHGYRFQYPAVAPTLADVCSDLSHELICEQWLPRTPEQVFGFFADAHNLEQITPSFVGFRVLRVSTPSLGAGTRLDYRLSLHGIPLRWQSRINLWEPNRRFVDSQVRGPYALWEHTHEFEPFNAGTIVRDRIRYALPGGAAGDLVGGRFVRRDLERIFDFRRAKIQELFS
jgi:uncharacterized protein